MVFLLDITDFLHKITHCIYEYVLNKFSHCLQYQLIPSRPGAVQVRPKYVRVICILEI